MPQGAIVQASMDFLMLNNDTKHKHVDTVVIFMLIYPHSINNKQEHYYYGNNKKPKARCIGIEKASG